VKISVEMQQISAEVGIDLSKFTGGEAPIAAFNQTSRELFLKNMTDYRLYLFVDELVFSKLDAKDDEVRVRAAMVRDIFRTARDMNNFFVQNDIDFHIICSVRPEIRDLINDLDAEIGKVFDGKSVDLSWDMLDEGDSLLFRLFKLKVIHSRLGYNLEYRTFVTDEIDFSSSGRLSLEGFLKTNTWSRPRDVVQLLNAIADKSPNSEKIGQEEVKKGLNEYGRRSFVEIVEEISVRHGSIIASTLRDSINEKSYRTYDAFEREVLGRFIGLDRSSLLSDLFQYGVIGNVDFKRSPPRYYWAHRGEEYFMKDRGVCVHKGLWNYFNIR
jgi:hypothetical protein